MMRHKQLLLIDSWVNLLLGLLILCLPLGLDQLLGLPHVFSYFYSSILGAVILGIGVALYIELKSGGGLGLPGAIAINLCGGVALLYWLIFDCAPGLTTRGHIVLWIICILVLGIGVIELINQPWKRTGE